jgi:hypothetical protein
VYGYYSGDLEENMQATLITNVLVKIKITSQLHFTPAFEQVGDPANGIRKLTGLNLTVVNFCATTNLDFISTATGDVSFSINSKKYAFALNPTAEPYLRNKNEAYTDGSVFISIAEINKANILPSVVVSGSFWRKSDGGMMPLIIHPLWPFPKTYTHTFLEKKLNR